MQLRNATRYIPVLLAAILLGGCAIDSSGGGVESQITFRLQQLEDVEAIRAVLLNYGRYLDARDLDAYSQLFTEDGVWDGGFGVAQSPAGIKQFMEENLGPGANASNTYHILSNFLIDVQGDTATAWSRWAFITPGPDGRAALAQGGRYEDELVRTGTGWKFARRVVHADIPSGGPPRTGPGE